MVTPKVKIKLDHKNLDNILKVIKNNNYISQVGIIGGSYEDNDVTIADVAKLQEEGSILLNIPSRSFLKKPIKNNLSKKLLSARKKISDFIFMEKNLQKAYELLGVIGETISKKSFTDKDNDWAPNAYITIHGGYMRNKINGKIIYIKGKGSSRPLIDTGRLRKSITHRTKIK